MRPLFSSIDRTPVTVRMVCLAIAACLAGCASKNPLIDEPASVSAPAAKPAQADTANAGTAATTTAQARSEASSASAPAASGVTTTGPTGIQRFLGIISPYKIDIQQGNFISREMVAQLREGMQRPEGVTREQVRFVLGTPLLTDIFHSDRWDYPFRLKKRTGEVISSHVTVFFKDNRLVDIDGGTLPTEQEYLAFIAGSAPGNK
ncbi:outer membrane protein assembly factor BamE [Noviherbaspirillum sp. CPCC 100848]|uniref:Outer membrane protein assembly factor BamE n=1 Tax=Noviherbaspirillum album TaxID=3080276 RepID=A0ABU6JAJ7_9BURK|nr:outer membrane protein assembly factor BamE [Noviherbaspirillum sp. CPCC 100848]MEC4720282.1 outer membrane protein assembly factor BamE [Noviherbaspirillum sp. CPCC 100848]